MTVGGSTYCGGGIIKTIVAAALHFCMRIVRNEGGVYVGRDGYREKADLA